MQGDRRGVLIRRPRGRRRGKKRGFGAEKKRLALKQ